MAEKAPYENLKVWQLAAQLAEGCYGLTGKFPPSERQGLTSQIRRAAAAVAANIVEGNSRAHRREYIQFCRIARSSAVEVRCLLQLCQRIGLAAREDVQPLYDGYNHLGALIYALIEALRREPGTKGGP